MVISTLADIESGKTNMKVPYRDSCLTKILCNALGGNSKTLMICAISPSSDNFEETLSTLRYADQAKKIKNKAMVNESATDKLIRELQQENEKFKKLLLKCGLDMSDMDFSKRALSKYRLARALVLCHKPWGYLTAPPACPRIYAGERTHTPGCPGILGPPTVALLNPLNLKRAYRQDLRAAEV